MTSISSISTSSLAQYASAKNPQKPDTSTLVDQLFNKLDTKQQGYVDKEQLQTALTSAAGKTADSAGKAADVTDLFAKIDGDGDGKITRQELGSSLQSLMDQVDNLAAKMRLQGSTGGQSAPQGNDQGFSKHELTQMAKDSSGTDNKRATFMSNIAENFDKVDSDANGKVTRDEAMAYAETTGQGMGQPGAPTGAMPPPGGAPGGPGGAGAIAETSSSESNDPADTNGDDTVSAKEALTYLLAQLSNQESLGTDESTAPSDTASAADPSGFSEKIARQILQLVQAYGGSTTATNDEKASASNNLSVSA